MTPLQHARNVLKPLFKRPVSPEQRQVCNRLADIFVEHDEKIDLMQAEIDELRGEVEAWRDRFKHCGYDGHCIVMAG